jgi:hypothetical protein
MNQEVLKSGMGLDGVSSVLCWGAQIIDYSDVDIAVSGTVLLTSMPVSLGRDNRGASRGGVNSGIAGSFSSKVE